MVYWRSFPIHSLFFKEQEKTLVFKRLRMTIFLPSTITKFPKVHGENRNYYKQDIWFQAAIKTAPLSYLLSVFHLPKI